MAIYIVKASFFYFKMSMPKNIKSIFQWLLIWIFLTWIRVSGHQYWWETMTDQSGKELENDGRDFIDWNPDYWPHVNHKELCDEIKDIGEMLEIHADEEEIFCYQNNPCKIDVQVSLCNNSNDKIIYAEDKYELKTTPDHKVGLEWVVISEWKKIKSIWPTFAKKDIEPNWCGTIILSFNLEKEEVQGQNIYLQTWLYVSAYWETCPLTKQKYLKKRIVVHPMDLRLLCIDATFVWDDISCQSGTLFWIESWNNICWMWSQNKAYRRMDGNELYIPMWCSKHVSEYTVEYIKERLMTQHAHVSKIKLVNDIWIEFEHLHDCSETWLCNFDYDNLYFNNFCNSNYIYSSYILTNERIQNQDISCIYWLPY